MNGVTLIIAAAMLFTFAPAMSHEAHVHGIGKLDVAVEGANLSLHLDTPLANLVGFEHTAKSDKDKNAIRKMANTLRDANALFIPTAVAECRLVSAKLKSSVLDQVSVKEAKTSSGKGHKNEHADLDADYEFNCVHPEHLNGIEVRLFSAFKGFQQIDVQIVTPKGQSAEKLLPTSSRISW